MKATGIVRRIDDLSRIVIPKEIRKNLSIRGVTRHRQHWHQSIDYVGRYIVWYKE